MDGIFFFLGENKQKNYMQLTGRCLIAFMFTTLLKFEFSFFQVSIIYKYYFSVNV